MGNRGDLKWCEKCPSVVFLEEAQPGAMQAMRESESVKYLQKEGSVWRRVVASTAFISESEKETVANAGGLVLALGLILGLCSLSLIVFGMMCHTNTFCWYYDGALAMTLIGFILFMPTMLGCCTLTVLYGKAVIQERQYQKLLEAAVQRREERACAVVPSLN